jgi:hypothetical protein
MYLRQLLASRKSVGQVRAKYCWPAWLGNVSVNTTRKMVSQLKSISDRLNLNVYRYMFRSS